MCACASYSGASVTGLNNNDTQIAHGKVLSQSLICEFSVFYIWILSKRCVRVIVFVLFVATESLEKFHFMVSVWICQQTMSIIHVTCINVNTEMGERLLVFEYFAGPDSAGPEST